MPDDPTDSPPVAVTPLLWVRMDPLPDQYYCTLSPTLAARWIEDVGTPLLVPTFEVAEEVLYLLGASKEDAALAITGARDGLANMKTQL